jgi:hypothetical protein
MAKDVQNAIIIALSREMFGGGTSAGSEVDSMAHAKAFFEKIKMKGQVLMDIWS